MLNKITWPGLGCIGAILLFVALSAHFGWGGEQGKALTAAVCTALAGLIGVFVRGLEEPPQPPQPPAVGSGNV